MTGPGRPPRLAVILAAGRGTRMRSELPKVLHRAAGRPLLAWVVAAAREAGCDEIFVVVPPDFEDIRASLIPGPPGVEEPTFVVQESQKGTGHALLQAAEAVTETLAKAAPTREGLIGDCGEATLLVLSGDTPLLTAETLERLATAAERGEESHGVPPEDDSRPAPWGALAVAVVEEPGSLGRVLTRGDGSLERIVEVADASQDELGVRRVNAGIYALKAPGIFRELTRLGTRNAQGEMYLTDAPGAAAARGERVVLVELEDPSEALGVNTRAELARAHRTLVDRRLESLMDSGVTVLEPARTTVDAETRVGRDTVVHPGAALLGNTEVGAGAVIHQGAWIRDSRLGDGVTVGPYAVLDGADVEAGACILALSRDDGEAKEI